MKMQNLAKKPAPRAPKTRIVNAFPWLLGLAASTALGSCCVICVPLPHPGGPIEQGPIAFIR